MTKTAMLLPLFTLLACTSETKDDDTGTEATTESETDPTEDSEDTEDEASEDCTTTGFAADESWAWDDGDSYGFTVESGDATLQIEINPEDGGPDEPGVYDLAGINPEECGLCVYAWKQISEDEIEPYFATAGTLEVATSGGEDDDEPVITVTFVDVVLNEMDIDWEAETGEFVEDGRTWCIDDEYTASLLPEGGDPDWGEPGVGEPLPELTAPDQNGEPFTLSDLQGTMAVILFNANDWCPYCTEEAETTEALYHELNDFDERYDVSFVELLWDGADWEGPADEEDAALWADTFGLTYPVLHGEDVSNYVEDNGIGGWPSYWIVDPLGTIRGYHAGVGSMNTDVVNEAFASFLVDNPDWVRDDDEHGDTDEPTGDEDHTDTDEPTGDEDHTDTEDHEDGDDGDEDHEHGDDGDEDHTDTEDHEGGDEDHTDTEDHEDGDDDDGHDGEDDTVTDE